MADIIIDCGNPNCCNQINTSYEQEQICGKCGGIFCDDCCKKCGECDEYTCNDCLEKRDNCCSMCESKIGE